MPGPSNQPTLANALRNGFQDLPGSLVVGCLADALKKCIDDPGLSWPAAVAAVTTTALNPLAAAGILGLGIAMKLHTLRENNEQARQVESRLRAQATDQRTMHDILLGIKNRSLTVGLDELALADVREVVTAAIQNNSPRLSDSLEAEFAGQRDVLNDELQNLRILAQDTNETVHSNAEGISNVHADLAEIKELIKARSPSQQEGANRSDSEELLDEALLRIARDAERGVESARKAIEDKSPQEAGDYFVERLAGLDKSRAAIQQRMDEDEVQISREAAEVLFRTGRIEEAEQAVQRIIEIQPNNLKAINLQGRISHLRGNLDDAIAHYQRLAEHSEDELWLATAYGNLATIYLTRGELDAAQEMFHKSLAIEQGLGHQEGMASDYGNLGVIHRMRGELKAAEDMHNKSLEISQRLGKHEFVVNQYTNLGLIHETRGDLDTAENMHRKSLELSLRLGRQESTAITYGNLGLIYKARGDLDKAEDMHRKALEIDERLGRQEGIANQYGNLGLIHVNRGNHDIAVEMLCKSLDINKRLGRKEGMAIQYVNLGLIAEQRGEVERAREFWTKSRDLFAKVGMQHMVEQLQGKLDGLPPA